MSKYHLNAVLNALRTVQLSGEPCEIGTVYEANLPPDVTLEALVHKFGLTMKRSKSTGRWIVETKLLRGWETA